MQVHHLLPSFEVSNYHLFVICSANNRKNARFTVKQSFRYIRHHFDYQREVFHAWLHSRNTIPIPANLKVSSSYNTRSQATYMHPGTRRQIYNNIFFLSLHQIYARSNQRPLSDWPDGHILTLNVFFLVL